MRKKFADLWEKGILAVLSGKVFFCVIMASLFYCTNLYLSVGFLSQTSFSIDFLDRSFPIATTPEHARIFIACYKLVTFLAACCCALVLYRSIFERMLLAGLQQADGAEVESKIPPFPWDPHKLQLIVGLKHNKFDTRPVKYPEYLILPDKALFQNIFVTGTIGTGKTASAMYPFVKQAMFYEANDPAQKAGMLILDVKGNFYAQVLKYAQECGREKDIVLIQLDGEYKYNPLHKPDMEPIDLASRSRSVMDLFSGDSKKDKFWDTKAQDMMTQCIRLLRMTNREGYVTLADIHRVIMDYSFLDEKIGLLQEMKDVLPSFDYQNCMDYFFGEFSSKAENTIATVKACVTEMTSFFSSSEKINKTFCPSKKELNFTGFEDCINNGRIIVLAMNVARYPQVSKTIAAYLKLDFQAEVQQRTEAGSDRLNKTRPVFFVSDEYQEFVTANDAAFYGLSRESKCCSIVSSQSYTSVLQTLKNKEAFDTLQQNLINKIWLRTDDKLTVDKAQFLTGKEEKKRYSKNISESMNDAKQSKIFGRLVADKSSVSESINVSTQRDFVFEESIFTQTLTLFKAICFTANEEGMNEPYLVHLMPYFLSPIKDIKAEIVEKKNLIKLS